LKLHPDNFENHYLRDMDLFSKNAFHDAYLSQQRHVNFPCAIAWLVLITTMTEQQRDIQENEQACEHYG